MNSLAVVIHAAAKNLWKALVRTRILLQFALLFVLVFVLLLNSSPVPPWDTPLDQTQVLPCKNLPLDATSWVQLGPAIISINLPLHTRLDLPMDPPLVGPWL